MNRYSPKLRQYLFLIVVGTILTSCENNSGVLQPMRLPACTKEGSIFEDKPFDEWTELYHKQVDSVIEAHIHTMKHLGSTELQCADPDFATHIPASSPLLETANMIPAWKNKEAEGEIFESDMQVVLLEFLRVYECSMNEEDIFLPVLLTKESFLTRGNYNDQMSSIRSTIAKEKLFARQSLSRTLSLVGGIDRLSPLGVDIECLKRSSLDLRNVLGIASDISSCLPRIWDAKGSLRDLKE